MNKTPRKVLPTGRVGLLTSVNPIQKLPGRCAEVSLHVTILDPVKLTAVSTKETPRVFAHTSGIALC